MPERTCFESSGEDAFPKEADLCPVVAENGDVCWNDIRHDGPHTWEMLDGD